MLRVEQICSASSDNYSENYRYRLDRAFWGKGIATEAAQSIKDYALNQLNIASLVSIIHVDNMASKRVAQKVGLDYMKQTNFKGNLVDIFYIKRVVL